MTRKPTWPILREAPSWRERTIDERAAGIAQACRAAIQLLADAPDRVARLRRIDPVPRSTLALLRRLATRGDV